MHATWLQVHAAEKLHIMGHPHPVPSGGQGEQAAQQSGAGGSGGETLRMPRIAEGRPAGEGGAAGGEEEEEVRRLH